MTTRSGRSLICVSAALSVSLLASCSGVAGGGSGGGSDGEGGSVSILLVDQPATKELQSTVIPRFEKESGIDVSVEIVPESGLDAKLATSMSGNQAQYDVVMTGAKNWGTLVSAGSLQPLDEMMQGGQTQDGYLDGFPSTLLENIKVDGKSYAMPYQVGADMLFYNRSVLRDAGLDPDDPPTTVDEVVEAAKAIDEKTDVTPFVGRGSREGNENSFTWLMLWFLDGGRWPKDGYGTIEENAAALQQPEAKEATQQYYDLLGTYGPKGPAGYTFAEAQKAMQDGDAGMWIDAAQLGPALSDPKASSAADDIGFAALTGEGGDDYTVGAVWGFSMATAAANPEGSWELIQYLTNEETGVSQVVSGTNGSTGRTDVLEDPQVQEALDPDFVTALKTAVANANPAYTPLIPEGQQIRGALALALSDGLAGDRDADATMTAASTKVEELAR